MRKKILLGLILLIGIYFTYRFFTMQGGIDMRIGSLFVAVFSFLSFYIALKKR
ncbi:hypothetical protein [Rossellomorea sp. NPDC077527]|uniref:hypothetical protein n=1 Tax=Rossellomorea sp. NPDC077527 TaxID=3364510 RepID=UPI0037CB5BD3